MEYKYNVSPEKYLKSKEQKRSISKTRTNTKSIINKKFKLSSVFDHKGAKHFLNSKKIALQQIKKGSEGILLIPYKKAYGKQRVGIIEPYSTLVFTFAAN